jgi:hypothetical protein
MEIRLEGETMIAESALTDLCLAACLAVYEANGVHQQNVRVAQLRAHLSLTTRNSMIVQLHSDLPHKWGYLKKFCDEMADKFSMNAETIKHDVLYRKE